MFFDVLFRAFQKAAVYVGIFVLFRKIVVVENEAERVDQNFRENGVNFVVVVVLLIFEFVHQSNDVRADFILLGRESINEEAARRDRVCRLVFQVQIVDGKIVVSERSFPAVGVLQVQFFCVYDKKFIGLQGVNFVVDFEKAFSAFEIEQLEIGVQVQIRFAFHSVFDFAEREESGRVQSKIIEIKRLLAQMKIIVNSRHKNYSPVRLEI